MKFKNELTNGIIIFLGIGIYFIILELLGISDQAYLRMLNIVFVLYGVNRTIKANAESGNHGYFTNFLSGLATAMIGAVLSVVALLIYINVRGGDEYLKSLSENFIFGGGDISIEQYAMGLFFESTAGAFAVVFVLMQYWKGKDENINTIDRR